MKTILHCTTDCISTPIGNLMIAADEEGRLRAVLFAEDGEVIRHQLRVLYGAGWVRPRTGARPAWFIAGDYRVL